MDLARSASTFAVAWLVAAAPAAVAQSTLFTLEGPNGCVDLDAGKAWAQAGDDLYLLLTRRTAWAGDTVVLVTTAGVPGHFGIVAITELDGAPVFVPLLENVTFDAMGELVTGEVVDPSWGLHDLKLQAWAIGRDGKKLVRSGAVELALR